MAVNSSKMLYPPFVWQSNKSGLQEDRYARRWTPDERRKMRHGTYRYGVLDVQPPNPARA